MRVRAWTYDVWGNARDGYEVNDRYDAGTFVVDHRTWHSARAIMKAARQMLGIKPRYRLSLDGDDKTIYINSATDGYPFGELYIESLYANK